MAQKGVSSQHNHTFTAADNTPVGGPPPLMAFARPLPINAPPVAMNPLLGVQHLFDSVGAGPYAVGKSQQQTFQV